MDEWDTQILDLENTAYNEGKNEGIKDAMNDKEAYEEGERLGYLKGFAISLEMEYYSTILLKAKENANLNERERKRCDKILEKIKSFPIENDDEFDFDTKINEVRSLYKSLGKLVIPFDYHSPDDSEKKELSTDW